jgi:hypothetical protein
LVSCEKRTPAAYRRAGRFKDTADLSGRLEHIKCLGILFQAILVVVPAAAAARRFCHAKVFSGGSANPTQTNWHRMQAILHRWPHSYTIEEPIFKVIGPAADRPLFQEIQFQAGRM